MLKLSKIFAVIFLIIICVFSYNIFSQPKKLGNSDFVTDFVRDTIPISMTQSGHILINVSVEDSQKTYPFLLDSGASNMIFQHGSKEFNLDKDGWGFGIGSKGDFFLSRIIKIEKLNLKNLVFKNVYAKEVEMDFDCQDNIYGVIGIGIMRNLVWQIDFEKKIIIVSTRLQDLSIKKNSLRIPLSQNRLSHHLKASIQLEKKHEPMKVLVDLGSNGILTLNEKYLSKHSYTFPSKNINGNGSEGLADDNKNSKEKFYLIPSLQFTQSKFELGEIPVFTQVGGSNLLGTGFLKNFKTTISWKDNSLILEPQDTLQNFIWKTAGFAAKYDKISKKILVSAVTEGTPASNMKVPLHGEILAINNILFSNKAAHCNFNYRESNTDTLNMIIRSNGIIKEYSLVKQPIF